MLLGSKLLKNARLMTDVLPHKQLDTPDQMQVLAATQGTRSKRCAADQCATLACPPALQPPAAHIPTFTPSHRPPPLQDWALLDLTYLAEERVPGGGRRRSVFNPEAGCPGWRELGSFCLSQLEDVSGALKQAVPSIAGGAMVGGDGGVVGGNRCGEGGGVLLCRMWGCMGAGSKCSRTCATCCSGHVACIAQRGLAQHSSSTLHTPRSLCSSARPASPAGAAKHSAAQEGNRAWNVRRVVAPSQGASDKHALAAWHLEALQQRVSWAVRALAALSAASLHEDSLGTLLQDQPGLGDVLLVLLDLQLVLQQYMKTVVGGCGMCWACAGTACTALLLHLCASRAGACVPCLQLMCRQRVRTSPLAPAVML